ncbi:methyltransferase domain-containing protein [Irpex rosettiformis]|uniref:Methyltransferase domain-containing protein n=1 Tax=Irpex rosettiformis TaxID=378272 RepID=A0ACB8UHC5_9APHY|nr:methyltransferase domain-containing protein [Irpex rosettiformis]
MGGKFDSLIPHTLGSDDIPLSKTTENSGKYTDYQGVDCNGTAQPDVEDGIQYWTTQTADYNGVLGGFGEGSLPRIDALTSRQFLQHLIPTLCTVPSSVRPLNRTPSTRRIRALDVGAGVGRVTSDLLLHLTSDVVLLEPVSSFITEAFRRGTESEQGTLKPDKYHSQWKGIQTKEKSVTFIRGTLQDFDPSHPLGPSSLEFLGRVGFQPEDGQLSDLDTKFDIIWCQWCLGHLSDPDFVAFLKKCKDALRDRDESVIVVKENLCLDSEDGQPLTIFDESDSSLTRSDLAWKKAFVRAGLTVVYEQVQKGFPVGLYEVKMYALR